MKVLKKYSEYILEHSGGDELDSLIKTLSDLALSTVESHDETGDEYVIVQELEVTEPFIDVDIRFLLKKIPQLDLTQDSYFSKMNWQHEKLEDHGYVVTGNVFMTKGNIPEIEIIIAIDSDRLNGEMFKKIYFNLKNTISHELNHLKQKGWNKDFHSIDPSSQEHRRKNNKSYSYFLLPEEIESMVYGMNKQSISQNVPIDTLFDKHLDPFVESGFMKESEKLEVIRKWLHHTLKFYPNAILSEKYSNIIDNI